MLPLCAQGKISIESFADQLAQQIQGAPARLNAVLENASKQMDSNVASAGDNKDEGKPSKGA